ncbi:kelch repeat-containing protein [Bacteroides sp. 224]|uniref:Kelch repeat-containing protein n=1 Tax=Bacteroides sp. 224 TaxID=2302936 RepID=UPI0013D0D564|nr:kelch repeat-containing protein [Bacteroides sp. 224]NDV64796.1 DNA-binding transcriptional activator [Bacteroides sp. 224]
MKLPYAFLLPFLFFPIVAFAQGVRIQGNDFLIDERSSYNIFSEVQPVFRNQFILDFEIAPMNIREASGTDIGYILRIKNKEKNTTYNIFYNDQGGRTVFKFNHEGRDVLITSSFDRQALRENQWIKMHLEFDLQKDSLLWQINDERFYAGGLRLEKEWSPCIHFGKSEHVIDIPTFELRNLSVGNSDKMYSFPLNENEGSEVHDVHKKVIGQIINPVWLINDAYYWKRENLFFRSRQVAGSNMNMDTQEVYYFNKDSITFYNVNTGENYSRVYKNECPVPLSLGTNFIDLKNKQLYVYEVWTPTPGHVMMAQLDLETFQWTEVSTEALPTQLHHHSCFFDEANRRYIIFGGFGNTLYNKNFYSFNLDTKKWETLSFSGDVITPRYFSSMGYDKKENALYVFGGMGNESGDQFVGRVYYYDLYKIDLTTNTITKIWEISRQGESENIVPVRHLIIADGSFYTLCYPEHFSKTYLKLYRFSLEDGSYEVAGDSIPILSEKITTHANLYYNNRFDKLYSIVQEFDNDDIASNIKAYSLLFPPATKEELTIYAEKEISTSGKLWTIIFLCLGVGLVGIVWGTIYLLRKKKQKVSPQSEESETEELEVLWKFPAGKEPTSNSIYLFGEFMIRDRNNRDITYLLSTKLKQAFLLILQYSLKNGISTQEFSEALWPDKSEDKVKNSRGVTINNLRKVLGDLDGINLVHDKGYYKLLFTEECYCDSVRCFEIVEKNLDGDSLIELFTILSRGKFLDSVEFPFADSFKGNMEAKLEPILLVMMEKSYSLKEYPKVIALCEGLFQIDPLNEEAIGYLVSSLVKLGMNDEAKKQYLLFATEYKRIMDTEYPVPFQELKV